MMKIVLFLGFFALLAVKLSHGAPAPDDEKKEVVDVASSLATPVAESVAVEVKAESVNTDAPQAVSGEPVAVVEEKKS